MTTSKVNSILAVDCGNVTTTAILVESNEGQFQLAAVGRAVSTHDLPWRNITLGIKWAIQQIESQTQRTLLSPGGWPITPRNVHDQGTDVFIVTSSAGPPLLITLVGLTESITLTSARRAVATTYTHIINELALDRKQNVQRKMEGRIQALLEGQPEAILLVGGTDGGSQRPIIDMANIISMAMQVMQTPNKPTVLYAGNVQVGTEVAEILRSLVPFRAVANVRPTLDTENLAEVQIELEKLYVYQKMSRLPGFDKLKNWTTIPVVPSSRSFEKVITYIGKHNRFNIIGLNLGSRSTLISTQAQDHQGATTLRSDIGIGHSLAPLLKMTPLEDLHRWLPFEMDLGDLHNYLLNKALYPMSLPASYEALMIDYAIAREAIRRVVEQARVDWPLQINLGRHDIQWHWAVGSGQILTGVPHPSYAALMMLDGLEPWGVTELWLDINGIMNLLGAIATQNATAAVNLINENSLLRLGTVIGLSGRGKVGSPALTLKITYSDGNELEREIPFGTIELIELPPQQKATVELRPARNFDIGLGKPGRKAITEVNGSLMGLIIDARGRPLSLPQDEILRQERLNQWLAALGVAPYADTESES